MMHPETNSSRDVRGVFVLDPDNVVQAIVFYPIGVGRLNIPPNVEMTQSQIDDEGFYKLAWFMWYKKN